jgi:nucleoside-diphosphate-sugar epimerase
VKKIKFFCFGFGQVAKNFIQKVNSQNLNFDLTSTSRNKTSEENFDGINYMNYQFDTDKYDKNLIPKLKEADHILISIPPKEDGDIVIKNFSKFLESSKIQWITYLSATSVYGDHGGEWVDENSTTKPTSPNGLARLKAEKSWLSLMICKNLPIQIFRLSGIYSNENNVLKRLQLGTAKLLNKSNNYFSRIHIEDIANILFKSLSKFKSGEIYNLADNKPTSSEEIILYGVQLLNIQNPKKIEIDELDNEMLKNFYKDSKKVNNEKIKIFFAYSLKFPTYVEGLNYIRDNLA